MLGLGQALDVEVHIGLNLRLVGLLLLVDIFRLGEAEADEGEHVGNAPRRGAIVLLVDRREGRQTVDPDKTASDNRRCATFRESLGDLVDHFRHAVAPVAREDRIEAFGFDMHRQTQVRRQHRAADQLSLALPSAVRPVSPAISRRA